MVSRLSQAVRLCRRRAERLPFEEGQPFSISVAYVSIPAKKCLAQRKNFSLPVTLGVGRIHPS